MKNQTTDAVVETAETAVEAVATKSGLSPKAIVILAGAALLTVGTIWTIKKIRAKAAENDEENASEEAK